MLLGPRGAAAVVPEMLGEEGVEVVDTATTAGLAVAGAAAVALGVEEDTSLTERVADPMGTAGSALSSFVRALFACGSSASDIRTKQFGTKLEPYDSERMDCAKRFPRVVEPCPRPYDSRFYYSTTTTSSSSPSFRRQHPDGGYAANNVDSVASLLGGGPSPSPMAPRGGDVLVHRRATRLGPPSGSPPMSSPPPPQTPTRTPFAETTANGSGGGYDYDGNDADNGPQGGTAERNYGNSSGNYDPGASDAVMPFPHRGGGANSRSFTVAADAFDDDGDGNDYSPPPPPTPPAKAAPKPAANPRSTPTGQRAPPKPNALRESAARPPAKAQPGTPTTPTAARRPAAAATPVRTATLPRPRVSVSRTSASSASTPQGASSRVSSPAASRAPSSQQPRTQPSTPPSRPAAIRRTPSAARSAPPSPSPSRPGTRLQSAAVAASPHALNAGGTCKTPSGHTSSSLARARNVKVEAPPPQSKPRVSAPPFVTCSMCGRPYGSNSIAIHQKQCMKKRALSAPNQQVTDAPVLCLGHNDIQCIPQAERPIPRSGNLNFDVAWNESSVPTSLPPSHRQGQSPIFSASSMTTLPRRITSNTTRLPFENSNVNQSEDRVECRFCQRKFSSDRIEKHESVCPSNVKSRKQFDSAKMRAKGTDIEQLAKQKGRVQNVPPPLKPKISKWRLQHEELQQAIRMARMATVNESQPRNKSHTSVMQARQPPAPMLTSAELHPEYEQCPYCRRRFSPIAAERHIPKCRDIIHKPKPPPASVPRRRY
ncbi:A C2HC-type zinc-finger protein [Pelomyxa schiedti]|nr:A C2HC-type zinc-finger protein [Pelomyxa schiedti]